MRRIVVQADVCGGKPVFEGTRITAQSVIEFLAAGDSVADVVRAYPVLNEEDVHEALRFSSKILDLEFSVRQVA
jgi:uncharacterized protein (DUF433 family)